MEAHLRADHVAFWNWLIPTMLAQREDWMSARSWQEPLAVMKAALWTVSVVCVLLTGVTAVLGTLQVRHSMLARRRKKGGAVGGGSGGPGCKLAV